MSISSFRFFFQS